MAMKNLANCAKVLEKVQQNRQFGFSSNNTSKNGIKIALKKLHVTAQQNYPVAVALPLPANIDPAETTRFSPQRARDISANAIITHQSNSLQKTVDITLDKSNADPHIESYDCFGAVNLNSSMQSNVPSPFGGLHKFTHLNMPGGQWEQDSKFMSHNLQTSHYTNLRREARSGWSNYDENAKHIKKGMDIVPCMITTSMLYQGTNVFMHNRAFCNLHELLKRHYSTEQNTTKTASVQEKLKDENLSRKDKLKRAFKEYGATIVVFHVGISLVSLGLCYLAVSRGIDVVPMIESLGIGSTVISNQIATGASTFVIAYCIHKVFAPLRISITLGSAPLIVRYLRKRGILKVKQI